MAVLEILFITSFFVLFSCYFAYPAFFYLLYRLGGGSKRAEAAEHLSVALITSLCNEGEAVVRNTYQNRLELDYPAGKLRIIFVVDGSSDAVKEVVAAGDADYVELFESEERQGKTGALNLVMPHLDADIVVFSDANSIYRKDAVMKLVGGFSDPKVGGVCGELQYIDEQLPDMTGQVSNVYMKYEQFVKAAESRVSTLTVYNGAIYAIRRSIHRKMNPQAANDFQHPIQVVLQGYKSVYEPGAIAYESTVKSDLVEFRRTIRITSRGWKGLFTYPSVLNPFKTGLFSVQFLFRKLLRWLSPLFMIAMLASSFLLRVEPFYLNLLILQGGFYFMALGGWLLRRYGLIKVIYYPYYFCLVNLAALLGFTHFLRGKDSATWAPSAGQEGL